MSLIVQNLTGSPVTLAAGSPAAPVVPANGVMNVTSELRGLTGGQYTSLESQRPAVLKYRWTNFPEYAVGTLTVEVPDAHAASHESAGADPVASLPTAAQKAALAGTSGTPGDTNRFVTNDDARNINARAPTAHASGHVSGGDVIFAATASVPGLMSAADKTRASGPLSRVTRLFSSVPITKGPATVHAAVRGDAASNDFVAPFLGPDVPRTLSATFGAAWDGGDVTIHGTDQFGVSAAATITNSPGTTVETTQVFATVTSASKATVGSDAGGTNTASLGTGDTIGIAAVDAGPAALLFVDGAPDPLVSYGVIPNSFTPTTATDSSKRFTVLVNV